jgi:hypothetical protein
VITQINLGRPHAANGQNFPSSSSSQPGIVAEMLKALDPRIAEAARSTPHL